MQMRFLVIFLCVALNTVHGAAEQKHIVIVTASYKNAECYQWNLDSVFNQDYDNWDLVYFDDNSSDDTANLVADYASQKGFSDKVILVANKNRCGAMENQYFAIRQLCAPTDIVIILDGDDRLAHSHVLSYINDVYADGTVWLTYGQYREHPRGTIGYCCPMPADIITRNAFREVPMPPSHLRTFYAGLFHKIKLEDLLYEGKFFPMCADMAAMLPMIEMAADHFKFIPDILLDYNVANPLNDHKVSWDLQKKCDVVIRARSPYKKN